MTDRNTWQYIGEFNVGELDYLLFDSYLVDDRMADLSEFERFPHVVNAAGFCVCLRGTATLMINARRYTIATGGLCVIMPHTIIYVVERSKDFRGYTAACTVGFPYGFRAPLGPQMFLFIREHPCLQLALQDQERLLAMCSLLESETSLRDNPCGEEVAHALASAVIYEVMGLFRKGDVLQRQPVSRRSQYFADFMSLLSGNFRIHRKVAFYADKLCITPRYLSAICHEVTGMTATECINNHIMSNARMMLDTTDLSVLQISEELNFPNPSFFSHFFRKHEGRTPKEYRNR